jgi:cytoskeletal protein CcmA (bactofilin family)
LFLREIDGPRERCDGGFIVVLRQDRTPWHNDRKNYCNASRGENMEPSALRDPSLCSRLKQSPTNYSFRTERRGAPHRGRKNRTGAVAGGGALRHRLRPSPSVAAQELTIGGRFKGTIQADRVILTSSAVVEGEIHYRSLAIEENAWFAGASRPKETSASEHTDPPSPIQLVPPDGNRQINGSLEVHADCDNAQ